QALPLRPRGRGAFFAAVLSRSVPVVVRLEGTGAGNAEILGPGRAEAGQLGAELVEMQLRDLLVEVLRQDIDLVFVLAVVLHSSIWAPNEPSMADQIVITEKTSQAKDIRAAVGSRYGQILPAEGHLLDLLEPEDVVPAWKRWSPILLRPEGLYGTRPAEGGNKAAKLKAIREALRKVKRVWLATD